MIVLGIDTSTWWASVAVAVDGETRAAACERANRSHATDLLPLIERVLGEAGVAPQAIGAVAVTGGPGSFSGLRVGLGTAKGLAYATGARLVAVPTLEALAQSVDGCTGTVVALLDARKGELYAARFERDAAGACRRTESDRLLTIDALLATLPQGCVVVGDAEEVYGEQIRDQAGPDVVLRSRSR
jgi:tRNA threonylcarbamoyladenosine biosynthesis protein TsaB